MPRSKISEFFGGLCSKVRVWHVLKSMFRVWSFSEGLYSKFNLRDWGSVCRIWGLWTHEGCGFQSLSLKYFKSVSRVWGLWNLWRRLSQGLSLMYLGSEFRIWGFKCLNDLCFVVWVWDTGGMYVQDVWSLKSLSVCFRAWGLRTIRGSLRRFELKIFVVRVQAMMSLNFSRFFVLRF